MLLLYQSQLFQIPFNLLVQVSAFGFQLLDFLHHGMDVDRLFFLEGINVSWDIEVVIVVGHFLQSSQMAISPFSRAASLCDAIFFSLNR